LIRKSLAPAVRASRVKQRKRSNDLAPTRGLFHLLYPMTPEKSGTLLQHLAPSIGGFMIFLAQRLLRAETDADKKEFVRGVVGLDKANAERKIAGGLITGWLLASWLKNRG